MINAHALAEDLTVKDMWICFSLRAHQKSLIRLMFRGTSLESQFSSPSPFSSFRYTPRLAQTSLLNTGMSRKPCATPQGCLLFGGMAEQRSLTGCESKALIEVGSEHTPINFPSRNDCFNTDFNDLVTTVAASEITDTIVRQLTSPLFSRERDVSANPFGVYGSQQQAAASGSRRRHRRKANEIENSSVQLSQLEQVENSD